jgi:hypothetical protein
VIRRLNYTGRRTIARSRVTVRLVPAADDFMAFSADYDLGGFDFPRDARVYIEAYNADSYMRFAFGTVGKPVVPRDTRLIDVTPRPLPKFRLKVVDETERHGLLLGACDKVIPLRPDEDLDRKQSLLPVEFCDLGERVWRLDTSDWPVLELNNRIENVAEAARLSGSFVGLLYPEVLRRLLHEIVVVDNETDPDADDSDWTTLWLRFASSLPDVGPPPAEATPDAKARREEWVDAAVGAFCRARRARARLEAAVDKELGP